MKKILVYVLLLSLAIGIVSALNCGDTIYNDTTLTEDLLNCSGNGIVIGANSITLDCNGHLIQGTSASDSRGVWVSNKASTTVKNCDIKYFSYGIYETNNPYNNTLLNNSVSNTGFGIAVTQGSNNNILDNTAIQSTWGIHIAYGLNYLVSGNTAEDNSQTGIGAYQCYNTIMSNNIVNNNNIYGIEIYSGSSDTTLINNTVTNCPSIGIRLEGGVNNVLDGNTANNNGWGLFLQSSFSNSTVKNNVVKYNANNGIRLDSSSNNLIYNNYFENNINAQDNGVNSWNTTKTPGTNIIGGHFLGGNYWSDYTGNDTTGDGLGDTNTPYNSGGRIANGGDYLPLVPPQFICGDANSNGVVEVGDVIFIINFLFKGGPAPDPFLAGDASGDGYITVSDIVYLINYLYKGGPEPCNPPKLLPKQVLPKTYTDTMKLLNSAQVSNL